MMIRNYYHFSFLFGAFFLRIREGDYTFHRNLSKLRYYTGSGFDAIESSQFSSVNCICTKTPLKMIAKHLFSHNIYNTFPEHAAAFGIRNLNGDTRLRQLIILSLGLLCR